MSILFTDHQIAAYIGEPKLIPGSYPTVFPFRLKGAHSECEFDVKTDPGAPHKFKIIVRQSIKNPLDFSVILALLSAETNYVVRLVRYNGKSHEHSNPIEKMRFYDFHVHRASERYMLRPGSDPETFAEPSDRYSDIAGAFRCLVDDCNVSFEQQHLI